jgi:hypothetical protein
MSPEEPTRALAPVILLTASRQWLDRDRMQAGIVSTLDMLGAKGPAPDGSLAIMRYGGAQTGGERIAGQIWTELGEAGLVGPSQTFYLNPADQPSPVARRDQRMIQTRPQPTVCIGFPVGASKRERDLMELAQRAGILVFDLGRTS